MQGVKVGGKDNWELVKKCAWRACVCGLQHLVHVRVDLQGLSDGRSLRLRHWTIAEAMVRLELKAIPLSSGWCRQDTRWG